MNKSACLTVCVAVACWAAVAVAAPHGKVLDALHLAPSAAALRLMALAKLSESVDKLMLNYTQTPNKTNVYLDSAQNFSQGPGRCGVKFFCVVYDILNKHNITQHKLKQELVGNLKNFIKPKLTCSEINKTPLNTTVWLPMDRFLSDLKTCIQCRTLNSTSTSC